MKRFSAGKPTFNVKPYISKRARNVKQSRNDKEDPLPENSLPELFAPSTSDVKLIPTLKDKICKKEISSYKGHSNVVTAIRWNEKKDCCFVSCSLDKSIVIWNVLYGKLSTVETITVHEEGVKDVQWTSNGEYLLTASYDKTAKLVSAVSGSCIRSYQHADYVTCICQHAQDPNIFISGTGKSGVFAWDVRQKKVVNTYKKISGQVQDLLFLPDDGKTFLTSVEVLNRNSMDQTVMALDFTTTAVLSNQIYQEPYACTSLRLHPNKRCVLAQSSAGYIIMFDVLLPWKLNKEKRFEGHSCAGYAIGFDTSINGDFIYSGSNQGDLFVYNNYTSQLLKKSKVFSSPLTNVACSRGHNSRIVMSSWDGGVALWE